MIINLNHYHIVYKFYALVSKHWVRQNLKTCIFTRTKTFYNCVIIKSLTLLLSPSNFCYNFYFVCLFKPVLYRLLLELSKLYCSIEIKEYLWEGLFERGGGVIYKIQNSLGFPFSFGNPVSSVQEILAEREGSVQLNSKH